ncbi:hypothetical protein TcWFU_003905 [Taenia crassiceps]|uniref:Uncharacterized protein n=1 Tax=Taenia crassiceps TaxID=6207 RepID=A0ABR4QKI6_9CEST
MSSNLYEFQNHDSSFYGDAFEELSKEKSLKGERLSLHAEYVNTEQGDHHILNVSEASVEKSFDESRSTSNTLQSLSSSNVSDINSTSEEDEGEPTIVASMASRIEEFGVNSEVSLNPPASAVLSAWSNKSQAVKFHQNETHLQKQEYPSLRSTSSNPIAPSLQVQRISRGKRTSGGSTSIGAQRYPYSTSGRLPSPLSSISGSCLSCNSRPENAQESEFGVTELAEALRQLSRDARFRSIRPLWRDPNSRLLPSDETASVEAMLREYNHLLLTTAASINVSSSSASQLAVRRPYHSTLNRWRQQERIQIENFILANRLRNIRPSPETSRDVLLKRYKEYFITPVTAQSLNKVSTPNLDNSLPRCRLRCSSARSTQPRTPRPLKTLTSSISARTTPPPPRTSVCGCNSTSRGPIMETPRSREVLESLNSVRRALHEQRVRGKL